MGRNVHIYRENGTIKIELTRNYRIRYERIYNNPEKIMIINERTGARLTITLYPFKVLEFKYNSPTDRTTFATIITNLANANLF